MSKYSGRIQEILENASSKKVANKRKSVIELLELYENEEALNAICKSTEQNVKGVVNWSYIIHVVHNLLLNEADRFANKETYGNVAVRERQNTCNLVRKTVQNANCYDVPLLKCTDIMPLVLQILGSNFYEYYHETYMSILTSYILPFRKYQANMVPENWQELLKICKRFYKRVSNVTSKQAAIDGLQMIVYHGCSHLNLLLDVTKVFSFLESVFLDVKGNYDTLAESAYKLTNTVCQRVATEYRITLCQFSENILPHIIGLTSSVEKYKLLLLFIKIHHPKGICKADDGAYAHNWKQWCALLKSMHLMVLKDMNVDVLSKSFIYLASEVFKQVLENPNVVIENMVVNEYDYSQPIKRRRITTKMKALVDTIIDSNAKEAWPIIQILIVLLKEYPECLKSQDLVEFLKIFVDFFTQSCKEEEAIMDNLYELAAVLLANEKTFSAIDIENSNIYWDKIWDFLLRSLNVNQNEKSTHKLTQLFIINNKITNPNPLLKLYLTNVMKWSVMSLRTLIIVCEYFPLPTDIAMFNINMCSPTMNSNSVRSCLLNWALNIPWQKVATQIIIDELCSLLISITSKSKHEKQIKFVEPINDTCNCLKSEDCINSVHEHIENCYLLLRYNEKLFIKTEEEDVAQNKHATEHILYMQDIVNSLMKNLCNSINESSKSNNVHIIIIKIAVIARVISMMRQLNMIAANIEEVCLVPIMKKYLDIAYSLLANMDLTKIKYNYLCNIIKALNVLYGTSYDTDVAKIIVSFANLEMLKNIFNLMNIEDNKIADYETANNYYEDYSSFQSRRKFLDEAALREKQCSFCKKGTIRIQTTKALTLFCCMDVGQEKSTMQTKLMTYLLKIDMYDLSHTINFKMAMIVLESLPKYDKKELWRNHEQIPFKNWMELYHKYRKDETAILHMLTVLPYLLKYSADNNRDLSDLMNIISELSTFLSKMKYFLVHVEFTKCVSRIIRLSPSLFHYRLHDSPNQFVPIIKCVLSSLTSPLFAVRLEAINCVEEIYSSRSIAFEWKETLFIEIENSINNFITATEITNANAKIDQNDTKVASVLLVLAGIISTNGAFQCRALLAMVRFVIDQKIETQIIPKAISTIKDEICYSSLIKENSSYLMSYWFNSKYSSQPFPLSLTECKSEGQFYKTYIDTLVFIKLQNLEFSSVMSLCDRVNLSFEEIIENIFPRILAWLLLCISEDTDSGRKRLANQMFHKLVSNQDEFVRVKEFSSLFNDKFGETLTYLIERLHDEDYLEKMLKIRISFALTDPPHFKKPAITSCLEYMESNFFLEETSIQSVLVNNCPNILQKILLRLISNIYRNKFTEHKIKAFHQYVFFVTLITEELNQDYFNKLSNFVIKDISYSLLHIIKRNDDILSEVACKYFYKFIKHVLPRRSDEIKDILSFIVATLIPIVQTDEMPIALKILDFLLIDQKEILCDAIEKLNSFPNVPVFQEMRSVHNALKYNTERLYSLEEEVRHFLNSLVDRNVNYSTEDVSHLQLQLSTRGEELQQLYDKLETSRGLPEDYDSSVLHWLIYKLIKLTASPDVNVAIKASNCLSELGPTDLTSMILHLEKSHVKETSDLVEILTYRIVIAMSKFLFQSDVGLRKVSADALYAVFSSAWGRKLLNTKYIERLQNVLNESQLVLPLKYIKLFTVGKVSDIKDIGIDNTKIQSIINPTNVIWTVQSAGSYSNWIVEITCKIAECFTRFYSKSLTPVCALSTDFCELILPRIIFLLIHIDKKHTTALCSCINEFFHYHFNFVTEANVSSYVAHNTTSCDRQIVRCMLNIINYIRIQVPDNVNLKLNYMYIAKAAQYCSAFYTAILYAELSCENILCDYSTVSSVSKIDRIYELVPEEGKVLQSILRDTYAEIGDFDAISGTGSSHLEDYSTRIQHYVHTHEWSRVMLAEDVELSFGNTSVIQEMANGLHQSGLQFLLGYFISTISKTGEKIDEDIQYECAWRLSNWNLCDANQALYTQNDDKLKSGTREIDYHSYHYQALKYFHEGNGIGVQNAVESARMSIVKALRNISLESTKTIYEKLMQLQLIREIEELSSAKEDEYEKVLQKWQQQNVANFNEFQYIEPILTQRTVMYQINDTLANNINIKNALFNTYLEISKIAADKENLPVATRSLAVLAKQRDLPAKIQDQLLYREALLARLRKDLEIGRFLLRKLMHKETLDPNLRARILRVYGDWMAETKSENAQTVINEYYSKSIDISMSINDKTTNSIKNLHNTQVALARFADAQFEQICSYMRSPQFESLKECVTYPCKGISLNSMSADKDVRKALILNQRQHSNDAAELEHIQRERDNYLILALRTSAPYVASIIGIEKFVWRLRVRYS
ncbi:serine/threonine-protein kinase tefu isoform X2 [Andrena cerasifolii]|uniref:serine/threonine-protein kinase tefu isoform X2 n=1 Tax=Andrena cerasifolii TaxID=2819439 RepID=UPI004037A259